MKQKLLLEKFLLQSFLICMFILLPFGISGQNTTNADIVVALDGSGNYTKIQDAINAVPNNSDRRTVIYLKRGKYDTEKLMIPASKKNITIIGESRDETIISYHMYDCSNASSSNKCPAEAYELWKNNADLVRTSATLTIAADGFIAENLTIENTAGPVGQALAITVTGDKGIYRNCNIKSYQDTIYLWTAGKRSYFEKCLVVGRTDYIYGAGIAFFQECEIRSWGGGWITAPSTPKDQAYGYVFNECKVTYATNSPRNGDDGEKFAFGRPWHEYPKVSWLYCEISDMLNPLGWPTKWNMDYSDTSTDLKLYEYKNTGPGADMSGRANWAGIRAMTDDEALNYTVQKVMMGSDNWDPSSEPPAAKSYIWTGAGSDKKWLNEENWNPKGVPASGESATIEGTTIVEANGNLFAADLSLATGAVISVTANSHITYLALSGGQISTGETVSLSGKIQTKAETDFDISGNLDLQANLQGVYDIRKKGSGILALSADNANYYGDFRIESGTITANKPNSLGAGNTLVGSTGLLIMNADNCFNPKSVLTIEAGGKIELNKPVVLSELFINGTLSSPGTYNASTHPAIFSGTESITVGRPSLFTWNPSESKTWENANNFKPALLPLAGDSVIVEVEMETSSVPFEAVILLQKTNIRLRNEATCTGGIIMSEGTKITYATSGTGFSMHSKIKLLGNIILQMSGSGNGNSMTFPGSFEGNNKITAYNYTNTPNMTASVILSGDNSLFSGIWDLTMTSRGSNSSAAFDGTSENAFGKGKIEVSNGNKVIISHEKATNPENTLALAAGTRVILNTNATIGKLTLGTNDFTSGTFTASSHPDYIEGPGTLTISGTSGISTAVKDALNINFDGRLLTAPVGITSLEVFTLTGISVKKLQAQASDIPLDLPSGIYIVRVDVGKISVYKKIIIN